MKIIKNGFEKKRNKAMNVTRFQFIKSIGIRLLIILPFFIDTASYVKVYLVNGKKCIAKAKTMAARKTLDPFYQQSLAFRENCRGCILQVINYLITRNLRFKISI